MTPNIRPKRKIQVGISFDGELYKLLELIRVLDPQDRSELVNRLLWPEALFTYEALQRDPYSEQYAQKRLTNSQRAFIRRRRIAFKEWSRRQERTRQ